MKIKSTLRASILAGGLLIPAMGWGTPAVHESFEDKGHYVPGGDSVSWVALPDRYLFTGGYFVDLSVKEMRIDHVAQNSRCTRKNRIFTISAGFDQPVGNRLFSSGFELPLLFADRFTPSRLATASVGDYVIHLSNTPMIGSAAKLVIAARF